MSELRFAPLFSGSSGNAVYVGCGDTHILIDAGVSGVRIERALHKIGVDPHSLTALLTTHEHSDHISGAGVLARKYGLPIYATKGTREGMEGKIGAVEKGQWCLLTPGEDFYMDELNIMPFATPHDSNESCGFCFRHKGARFALATDVGCARYGWTEHILGADAILLESNYDRDMLETGSYPYDLKKRILSSHGHLRNEDAADLAVKLVNSGTRHIVLGHLSKENNMPEIARLCAETALKGAGIDPELDMRLDVALRDDVTGHFAVTAGFGGAF